PSAEAEGDAAESLGRVAVLLRAGKVGNLIAHVARVQPEGYALGHRDANAGAGIPGEVLVGGPGAADADRSGSGREVGREPRLGQEELREVPSRSEKRRVRTADCG